MTSEDFRRFAEAYVDGEFDEAELAEFRAFLAQDAESREQVENLSAFKQLLQDEARADRAPEHLRAAVLGTLKRQPQPMAVRWTYAATAAAAGVLLLLFNFYGAGEPEAFSAALATDPILDASVDWHRSNLPVEVTGPDAEIIRDWFADKVDFPVRLPNFEPSLHANVLGGRLSHLNDQRAAHVLYEVDGAKVSVMLFQTHGDLAVPRRRPNSIRFEPFRGNRHGYNVALFEDNGVTYTITTALPQATFDEMVSTVHFRE